jgi:hypothetical protein
VFVGKGNKGADKSVKFNNAAASPTTSAQSLAPNTASLTDTKLPTPTPTGDLIDYTTDTDTSDISTTSSTGTPIPTPPAAASRQSATTPTTSPKSTSSSSSPSTTNPDALPATLSARFLQNLSIDSAPHRQNANTRARLQPSSTRAKPAPRRASLNNKSKTSHRGRGRCAAARHAHETIDDLAAGFGLEREREKERAAREGIARNGIPGFVPYDHDD